MGVLASVGKFPLNHHGAVADVADCDAKSLILLIGEEGGLGTPMPKLRYRRKSAERNRASDLRTNVAVRPAERTGFQLQTER